MVKVRLVEKFLAESRSNGISSAVKLTLHHIRYRVRVGFQNLGFAVLDKMFQTGLENEAIARRTQDIANRVGALVGNRVAYGPFKGLYIIESRWWGRDRAGMLLGLYEKEILDLFDNLPASHRTFIDLGAADGYYAIGALISGKFDHSYCYEMSERGRKQLLHNAQINNVSNYLTIWGTAEPNFWKDLQRAGVDLSNVVMICDIEGAEFDLLDEPTLQAFQGATIIIELHDFIRKDGEQELRRLKGYAEKYFRVTEFVSGSRDPSAIPELKKFSDDDRWLICSEDRPQLMTWLKLEPK